MTTAQTALNECFICLIPLAVIIVGTVLYLVCKGLFGKGDQNVCKGLFGKNGGRNGR